MRPAASRHPEPATLPTAAELQNTLAARRASLRSLRALARIRYREADDSTSSREALVVARPDRLRIEVLSVFGSMFVLTADNGRLTAYARQENTVYRGQASAQNLWRYARVALPVNDLVDLVLGTPPARHAQRTYVSFDRDTGRVGLWQDLDAGAQLAWFSDTGLPLAAEESDANGRPKWRATFSEYQSHGALPVSTHITLDVPRWKRSLEIALEDVDVNPSLDASIFALQIPPGSKVVDLDGVVD